VCVCVCVRAFLSVHPADAEEAQEGILPAGGHYNAHRGSVGAYVE
jgi:hypothetical protein